MRKKPLNNDKLSVYEFLVGEQPPNISPNFVNPRTLAPAIIAVNVVMMSWALLFVFVRIYAIHHAPRGLGIDDCEIHFVNSIT